MKNAYRKEGYLKVLNRQGIPKHVFSFDTETFIEDKNNKDVQFPFRLAYCIYYRLKPDASIQVIEERQIYSGQELLYFIESKLGTKDKAYVFAHNIAFDLRVLNMFDTVMNKAYTSDAPILNNMVFLWTAKKARQSIVFVDSSNLGVRSVRQLGDDMGYEKLDIDFNTCSDQELLTYCKRDVEIVGKFVLEYLAFIAQYKLGQFKLTLAGQSLEAYRTRFNHNNVYIHNYDHALRLERDAYYGGRTECFRLGYLGYSDYYYLDVNSMYPYMMRNAYLPTKHFRQFKNPTLEDLYDYEDYYLIADVSLNTLNNAYPLRVTSRVDDYNYLENPLNLYNYPERKHKRLIFPIGTFRTSLHDCEIKYALEHGDILEVHRLVAYHKSQPFKEYVNFFYELKKQFGLENNKSWRMISKLFLNSLYGKFGQLQPQREEIYSEETYQIYRETNYDSRDGTRFNVLWWYGQAIKEYKKGETAFSSPAIAGAITAYARHYLYTLIELAGKENVFYTDTDSLICNQQAYNNLHNYLDDNELGKLSLEHRSRRLIIYGNKDYRFDDIKRFKGLPKSARKIDHNLWDYILFQGFISWMNEGGKTGMRGRHAKKSRQGVYSKAVVDNKGFINPFHLFEDC